MLLEEHTNS